MPAISFAPFVVDEDEINPTIFCRAIVDGTFMVDRKFHPAPNYTILVGKSKKRRKPIRSPEVLPDFGGNELADTN